MPLPRPPWINPYTDPRPRELYRHGYLYRYSACGENPPPDHTRSAEERRVELQGYNDADAVIREDAEPPKEI